MSGKDNIAIKVNNVSKNFVLNHEKTTSIKSSIVNLFREKRQTREEYRVLRGVSFEVRKGEFFGIVGRNGSGKSTLLKIISEIYQPTSGSVEVDGKLVPFIELGVGFNPELTGRENVYLNGALLGFNRSEINDMYEEIVEFAELEDFMDQKLKNYSSGMQVRLAFSVAIKAKGDILVLDEVLAVGDEAFQRKCEKFFDQIKKDKTKTVILVTHTMENIQKYCDRAMMINEGEIAIIGRPSDVANGYSLENFRDKKGKEGQSDKAETNLFVSEFYIKTHSKPVLEPGDIFEAELIYSIAENVPVNFGITIMDIEHRYNILNDGQDVRKPIGVNAKGRRSLRYRWKIPNISDRKLLMVATLNKIEGGEKQAVAFTGEGNGVSFLVKNMNSKSKALLAEKGSWDESA